MLKKSVTIKEIAKELNLSVSTISRALHDHPSISAATRLKVKQVAQSLHYEPNQAAVHFQKGKTFTIGVILPELSETFFAEALSTIEDIAYKRGYTILLGQSHDDEEKEKLLAEKMRAHRVEGLIVSLAKNTTDYSHFEQLRKYHIPVLYFDRIPPLKNIHHVSCNIETGSTEAVNYLLKQGHRNIALINGPASLLASKQRREGYIKALQKNRLKFDPALVVNCDLTEKGTKEALETLICLKRKPSAIIAFNDYVSSYAVRHAANIGLKINEDICFVSFANSPINQFMQYPPLASVEQFPAVQGQKAIDTLLDIINNKTEEEAYYRVVIDSELIEHQRNEIS